MRFNRVAERILGLASSTLVVICLTGTTTAQAAKAGASEKETVVYAPDQEAVIPPTDIPRIEKEAMEGSPLAARRLAMYQAMVLKNDDKEIYWFTIAAENGDPDARFDLALALSSESDSLSRVRARYWLNKLVKEEPPDLAKRAEFGLQNLDFLEKRRQQHKTSP